MENFESISKWNANSAARRERWKRFLEPLGVTGCREGRGGASQEKQVLSALNAEEWGNGEHGKSWRKFIINIYILKSRQDQELGLTSSSKRCQWLFWSLLKPSAWFLSLRIRVSSLVSDEFLWTGPLPRVGALSHEALASSLISVLLSAAPFGPLGWAATSSYPTQGHSSSTPEPASCLPHSVRGRPPLFQVSRRCVDSFIPRSLD